MTVRLDPEQGVDTFAIDEFASLSAIRRAVDGLRETVRAEAQVMLDGWREEFGPQTPSTENLSHYIALRRHDLRSLQRALTARGLSSLGRLESRVMPTLDAVADALAVLDGERRPPRTPDGFYDGEARLEAAAEALLGPAAGGRRGRIMVTLPGESAGTGFVGELAARGMDVARINCAHDAPDVWRRLAADVREAGRARGRPIRIIMDVAGPKIRTGEVLAAGRRKAEAGDVVRLVTGRPSIRDDGVAFSASVSLPEIVDCLRPGQPVLYDDGKLSGVVMSQQPGEALVKVLRTKTGGVKLKPEKGLNLPETDLGLAPLTVKDVDDLDDVLELANMLGYSFVSRPSDVDLLEKALTDRGGDARSLGLVAKIERPEAIRNLPALIARLAGRRPFGVMIARGDLAAEIGFERLAEMQEELLWLCEAASVPVIWATQVLEDLVKDGVPSRGEMTDAAMATRAECVMLNKGPCVAEGVDAIAGLYTRMDGHLFKKSPRLRALRSW